MKIKAIQKKAATLVVTLLVLALMSTIVVAFLQTVAMERSAARSVANRYQAELAAEAGLNAAIAQILQAASSNQTFVTGLYTNVTAGFGPVTTIGITNLSDTNQLMPLISTDLNNLTNFGSNTWSGFTNIMAARESTNSTDLNSNNIIQTNVSTNYYRAPWVSYSTNSFGVTRYSYYVLDEHARVNPLLPGTNSAFTNSTNWYSGPQDLILTNASGALLSAGQQSAITNARSGIFSPETLAQALSSKADYESIKHLVTTSQNPTYDTVPQSLPIVTNALITNRSKIAINNFATNSFYGASTSERATNLANLIYSNIPSLGSRDPALRGTSAGELRYLRRLSAAIIDYITDSNSPVTIVNGAEPAGQKLTPHVTAIAIRYRRTSLTATSTTIESQPFIQIWNPYTSPIIKSNAPTQFIMRNRMRIFFGTGINSAFNTYNSTINTNITLLPNQFEVIEFPVASQTWTSPPTLSTPFFTNSSTGSEDTINWPTFEFYYDSSKVNMQAPTGGLMHNLVNFNTPDDEYHANFIPTELNSSPPLRFVGDPRASYLTTYTWRFPISANYPTQTWWKGIQPTASGSTKFQDFYSNWVDRDFVRANPSPGNPPGLASINPATVSSGYNPADADVAISVIRNGPMFSIGELGHIFDPAQADDELAIGAIGRPAGGRTLRIGQPEFQINSPNSWAKNLSNPTDRSAIQLLDVLSANPVNAAGFPFAIGRINPNTAPIEVLASMLSGIVVKSDAGVPPSTLENPTNLAKSIITNRPYNKISDLSKILSFFAEGTSYSPSIPNISASYSGGATNLAVMDRMREEAFGKLVPHLAVQSRTYRILVVGELLDRAQRPLTRAQMEAVVFFEINPTGRTTPIIQFRKSL